MKRKAKSKKGFTLVEAVCGIMILAIVTVGVLNAVAFSREMVYTNNSREKASDKGQFVADELFIAATGVDPADTTGVSTIVGKMNAYANASDVQTESIGIVKNVSAFSAPVDDNEMIQYILTAVPGDTDIEFDTEEKVSGIMTKSTVHKAVRSGWDIQIRVYYRKVGGDDELKYVDISAFAPYDYVK